MRVILVRHAETPENVQGKLQGRLHSGFTDTGSAHLRLLKKKLDYYRFDRIFTSDLPRTLETARYLTFGRNIRLLKLPLIREKSAGRWSGKKHDEVDWEELGGDFLTRRPPNGESINDVLRRVDKFIAFLKKLEYSDVLVVSHGAFLKLLTGKLLHLSPQQSIFNNHIDHCSITELCLDTGKLEVRQLSSVSHLKK